MDQLGRALLDVSNPQARSAASLSTSQTNSLSIISTHQTPQTQSKITLNLSCGLVISQRHQSLVLPSITKDSTLATGQSWLRVASSPWKPRKNILPSISEIWTLASIIPWQKSDSFASIRARSSFLIVSICAVASLCTCWKDCEPCLKGLMDESRRKMLSDRYTFDDVCAPRIGAFWLNEVASVAYRSLLKRSAYEEPLQGPHGQLESH
jgi:hypothetical protein